MKVIAYSFILLFVLLSCKNENAAKTIKESALNVETKQASLNESMVLEMKLLSRPSENIELKNLDFNNDVATFFGNQEDSYIKIPEVNLDLSNPFNVSFSYNTNSEDGSKPQTFIAFVDKYSSPARTIPLYIYTAGKRITGVYGDQTLWANNYDRTQGESKTYFDSYQLSANEFYFISINFTGNTLEVYVNSELYTSFKNINPHGLKFENVIIGSLTQGSDYVSPFKGMLYGLKIFNKSLSMAEIVEVYNAQPYVDAVN
ncbi:LamG-like jellyroll fold domain-containing protein [Paucihalobacter sp.]|uniref:LamG-like jellyroll fold domain-containing protein n=1 Tax=Paucihalobacter sp. TaxID=2850405 RepID=UPI003D160A08